MGRLAKRVQFLESAISQGSPIQVVLWGWGASFDDALARSAVCHREKAERLLIQLVPAKGGHGEPVIEDWRPSYQEEFDKAVAWSEGR